jgi:hypothetical protein
MSHTDHFSKNSTFIHALFILLILAYVVLGQVLLWNIPYSFPFGGPDEPMHLSMANYIANHLSWPQWDSTEVARNAYGVSYSPGGSIVYWLHGLSYKLFGYHRLGAYMLLLVYLLLSIVAYRKNRLAGFLLLAGLLPQTLFTFSYINSDVGTIIAALLFGMSVGYFLTAEDKPKNFFILLFFAGLTITAKLHLWAIAFLTLVWVVVYKRKILLTYPKKVWLIAILIGLVPASWWFITSFLANDGDFLGIFTSAKAIAKFGGANLPSLARDWASFSINEFLSSTLISFYANWGWMSLPLDTYTYTIVSIIASLILFLLYKHIDTKVFIFFCMLLIANFAFMIVYSVAYDYQAQGRYLFPSFYIILGMLTTIFINKKIFSKVLLWLLILLSVLNIYFSTTLTLFNYVDTFLSKPVLWKDVPTEKYHTNAKFHIDGFQISEGKLSMRGWAYDATENKAFDTISLVLKKDNTYYKIELDKEHRPDVANAFGNTQLKDSGFTAKLIDLQTVPHGIYNYLFAVSLDNNVTFIDIHNKLKI